MLLSVGASVGVFGFLGVPATLIIFEIIPFLVLAVGVDNIFILVQTYQRDPRGATETHPEHVGRIVGEVAPSMLLSSVSESTCFFLGSLSDMPAVRAFALYAGMALMIDFIMQITCFVSLIALDMARQENNRFDLLCCVKASKKSTPSHSSEGMVYKVFKHLYAPFLLKKWVRPAVMIIFFGWFCSSMAVVPKIEVGLDQEISMPDDSYVQKYFEYLKTYLSVGPPFYVVLNSSNLQYDFSKSDLQNRICGTSGCNPDSLQATIKLWSLQSNVTYIASPAQSWIDDYFSWLTNSQCCKYDPDTLEVCQSNVFAKEKVIESTYHGMKTTPKPIKTIDEYQDNNAANSDDDDDPFSDFDDFGGFGDDDDEDDEEAGDSSEESQVDSGENSDGAIPNHMFSNYDQYYYYDDDDEKPVKTRTKRSPSKLKSRHEQSCVACETRNSKERPTGKPFKQHLQWFLQDNPGEICPVAGQAAYRDCLRLTRLKTLSQGGEGDLPEYGVNASNFMAFHSILKSSRDYTQALAWSRKLTDRLEETINEGLPEENQINVFPYSIFYVFYEQYLTMWEDTLKSLGVSLLAIFVVTYILMGFDLR